ncbi:preprotein translocase subunit SecE [Rhodococcus sp. HNM0563]|uniref:preprotein translocase subunit SecE n=1 Tax=unclassified Rhodococcus (in: high G+C Gram-positive bacteria) TaxID=192944 RepID=UPI00146A2ADB|nr:preprotein translocase subunit SecE [Rhodococcus sp. F64268]MCK0090058.1 preprotein translocase subunit SecE [Rhodococcus sp. F64268]NLU64584.1 preprotein translocase subunit SecE [Rhodococcus sp. HNM0563]
MSEERGRRDGGTGGFAPGDAGTETGATPDASSSVPRPSGKRAVRRSGAAQTSVSTDVEGSRARRSVAESADRPAAQKSENIFKRLRRFFREVIAELRKVIWPNRKQLTTYTLVVIAFVTVMTAFIFGLDLAFAQGVNWLFG